MAILNSGNSSGRPAGFVTGGGGAAVVVGAVVGRVPEPLLLPQPAVATRKRATAKSIPIRAAWRTNVCSPTLSSMQLRLDAADRLVELVEERRGPVPAEAAA